jgi:DNA-binding response OmpR family regulator
MPVRILIAEEQQECCQLFKQFLQRYGYEITAVHDGVSCIEAFSTCAAYDVLILSWELPWGEGEAILDWVQYQGINDLAVVVLTAQMDVDVSPQESALTRVTWLQRPFRLFELLDAIVLTEGVPRNSWRCLESLIRRSTKPVNGVLFDSDATTTDPVEMRIFRPIRSVQEKESVMSALARDMQSISFSDAAELHQVSQSD